MAMGFNSAFKALSLGSHRTQYTVRILETL